MTRKEDDGPLGLRVYELAKEIGKNSKYLLLVCKDLNLEDVENHMNVLTDEQEDRIREYMGAPAAVRLPKSEEPEEPKRKPRRKTTTRKKKPAKPKKAKKEETAEDEATEAQAAPEAATAVQEAPAEAAVAETEPTDAALQEVAASATAPGPAEPPVKEQPKRDPLDWTPEVRIKGTAAVGKIDLPLPALPEEPPARVVIPEPIFDEPTEGPPTPSAHDRGGDRKRGESGPQRRKGKKVFVPSKDQGYRGRRRRRPGDRGGRSARPTAVVERPSAVTVEYPVTVKSLSAATGIKAGELLKKLMTTGVLATINDTLDNDVVEMMGAEFEVEITVKPPRDLEEELRQQRPEDKPEDLTSRAPVVVFLGHVDHGKTSLLDAIRKTKVTETEAGGITQHFSAYKVNNVVFLDTPGHEAFTEMRARGANVTDVAVLVVAADDGIMPQTEEAVNHAKAAGVPIVVALNKIDKPEADPMKVKGQLAALDLAPEEWGGSTVLCEVSATTGQGVPELLEMLALESELLELKANPNKGASGTVLEAELSEGRGIIANVLVMEGTLRRTDVILCGAGFGRIRHLRDDTAQEIAEAGPATPVEIWGLNEIPEAGDSFFVVDDLSQARAVAVEKQHQIRMRRLAERHHVTLENLFSRIEEGKIKELRVVLKCDVKGTIEALTSSLAQLGTDEVKIRILHSGVGGISESDILLADASDAIVIGFSVSMEERARALSEDRKVQVRTYDVIYQVISDVHDAMEGMLEPEEREIIVGHAEVRQVFRISRFGVVAGCRVSDGLIERSNRVRLVREGTVVHTGTLASIRREKDDVREVREGFECGMKIADYDDVKIGDVIESFRIEKIARKLS